MPLPFPWALKSKVDVGSDLELQTFQRGINLCVLVLNWLYLKRPVTCPAEIVLHTPLSKLQWKVVRYIEQSMLAWREAEPVTADTMGRAAGKLESIEKTLSKLVEFEDGLDFLFDSLPGDSSGAASRPLKKHRFAPGLQHASAGEVIGELRGSYSSVAKPIIADRLDFRGEPNFDPSPFLDAKSRFIFQDPLSAAISPSDASEEPPSVKLFGDSGELWKLFKKLDDSGRLGAIPDDNVWHGYQAGLFAVGKDDKRDRLIFDSRPFNTLESAPNRWVRSMASRNLTELHLLPHETLICSGTDLREFYYSFKVSGSRLVRNSLLFCTRGRVNTWMEVLYTRHSKAQWLRVAWTSDHGNGRHMCG